MNGDKKRLERVVLKAEGQFGEHGPKPGDAGIVIGRSITEESQVWYQVLFEGHTDSYYCVREDMVE